ncbi:MAG TPA: carboxyl transferase domain-containing protein [Gammaproteobacteria bacterium]|jgi:acetyl-CoA carboxylase carboxyltransferase component|nr:carboxyl transferase domain-containing protein [Candidatus Hydrogenedentota bacterium]HJP36994.1 carboxyl transferase domain-containing protein [Gammaproteobacteria bacterium]
MTWHPEIDELKHRQELARQMGGPEGVARQHKRGKLTVRERIALLGDPGSFQEIGGLAGRGTYENGKLAEFTPANALIGTCRVDGRKVVLSGGDFTVRGGSAEAAVADKRGHAEGIAMEWRFPYVRLLDATGGSVKSFEKMGRTYIPGKPGPAKPWDMLSIIPVVSAVMGSVAGLPAVEACLAHFNLMVKGTSQVFVGGPPVVKAALGYDIPKEGLGNEEIQVAGNGVIENLAEDEEDAFRIIRRFLSYMPRHVWELPPRREAVDPKDRSAEELLSIIPRDHKKAYDPYAILDRVLDGDSLFEIAPLYGGSRIVGLARVNGYAVGVMCNNPNVSGGATDVAAGEKITRFLKLCDTFHLPMVYFADEPGFMVGLEAEKQGIVRAGARLVLATRDTRVPWITFVTRQLYGVAGGCHARTGGMFRRYAWPSGNWGSMHISGGVTAAYRREIDNAPDPEAKKAEIEARLNGITSPFRSAEAFDMEDIIDPRETRALLCDFLEDAQAVLREQFGPPAIPYRP